MKRLLIALALLCSPAAAQESPIMRPVSSVVLTSLVTTSPITSTQFNAQIRVARMICTVSCLVAVVSSPIVAATSKPVFLAQNVREYFAVTPGQIVLVRSEGASGGVLYLNEMDR